MIQTYMGVGLTALAEKLQELWDFHNTEIVDSVLNLWISEEVYINFSYSMGQCVVYQNAANYSVTALNTAYPATFQWKIIRTACGVAFGAESLASVFIGRTLRYDGVEGIGCVAKAYNSLNYHPLADDQAYTEYVDYNYRFKVSDHYTQLYNVACATAPVYFPDLYYITCSPQTTDRITQIGTDYFFAGNFIAIRDAAASVNVSTDLSNYYTIPQVDAKVNAVETVLTEEITAVSEAVQARIQSIKVYVSATGSDDNDGLSASAAFATLGRALEATSAYGMTEISVAAGEYEFPSTSYYIYNRDLRITGAGSDQTTLYGKLYAHRSNLELISLTLDGSNNSNTGSAPLTVAHGATVRVDSAVINAPTSGNGIYVTAMGHLFVSSSAINSFSTRMLYLTIDAEAVLSSVSCTTDSTAENIMAGATAFLRMVDCPDVTYTTQYAGIIFVDGVQRSPVDITTGAVQVSTE